MNLKHVTVACVFSLFSLNMMAAEFSQFRGGPDTRSPERRDIPERWSADENLAWMTPLAGGGWSQPIVWSDRVFLTTAVSDKDLRPKDFAEGVKTPQSFGLGGLAKAPNIEIEWQVLAFELASGKPLWSRTISKGKPRYPVHPSNTYATETAAVDEHGVYVYFGATGLVAGLSHEGEPLWQHDIGAFPTNNGFGTGSSLALDAGRLFVQNFTEKSGDLLCFDTKSGNLLWRSERKNYGSSWSTPVVWKNEQRTEIVVSGGELLESFDPATGNQLWSLSNVKAATACSLAIDSQRIYFGGSDPFSNGPLFAVKCGGTGDLSPKKKNGEFALCSWLQPKAGPGMASPVSTGEYVFVPDNNVLKCFDAETGTLKYQTRLPDMKTVVSCPLVVDSRLLLIDEAGTAVLVEIGPEFKVVGGGTFDDTFWASPAITEDTLLFRGVKGLYAVRSR